MTKKMYELESHIMSCWAVVDDIKGLFKLYDLREVDEDEVQNYLLGLSTIYQAKFEHLFNVFEQAIKEVHVEREKVKYS